MKSTALGKFVSDIRGYHELTYTQQQNIQSLTTISKAFLSRAKISPAALIDTPDHAVILDSGHQPNFLPYPGIWKKAFLLGWFQEELRKSGAHSLAFFGFADQNLTTAKILSRNQIPYWNRKGNENIGFRIDEREHFRPFCTIQKPSRDKWEKEMGKIAGSYPKNTGGKSPGFVKDMPNIDDIISVLWQSYENSRNFAELNAMIFAKICIEILGIENVRFYTFSDLSCEKIFLDESREILLRQDDYNSIYNSTIAIRNLDLRPVTLNRVPFWYHCECGGKLDLTATDPGIWTGSCPLCRKEHHLDVGPGFERLGDFYARMDFSAVSRNIIFAMGMGSSLFLSGAGGSSSYGILSDEISRKLGYYQPLRMSWVSRDFYFGRFHAHAILELMKTFNLTVPEISNGSFTQKIASLLLETRQEIIAAKERGESEKNQKKIENTYKNLENTIQSAAHLFKGIPSFIDLLATLDAPAIVNGWNGSLEHAVVEFDGAAYKIRNNVILQTPFFPDVSAEDIPAYYKMIESTDMN